jgi:hypothetical protein
MKRILFVAVATSPLAARWINQLADSDWMYMYSQLMHI